MGGIAIVPNDIGYSLLGGSREALSRIFATKQRAPQKLNAMVANDAINRELHACSARGGRSSRRSRAIGICRSGASRRSAQTIR